MKILVVGQNLEGDIVAKVNAIHTKHGPFDLCISMESFVNKDILLPSLVLGEDDLGGNGVLVTKHGLRIAYSSNETDQIISDKHIDILITSNWPLDIERHSLKSVDAKDGSTFVKQLAVTLQPRYHFTNSDTYFEREPYQHEGQVTRFISLGKHGSKTKWFYAFNLEPGSKESVNTASTASPYIDLKRPAETQQVRKKPPPGYICNICQIEGHFIKDCQQKQVVKDDASCWFCLSNPQVAKHLVVSVAESVYLTLPKGPVVDGHVLVVPISHVVSQKHVNEEEVNLEVSKYKVSLKNYYQSMDMVPVYFETSFRAMHMILQCIPVPKDSDKQLRTLFMKELGELYGKDAKFQKFSGFKSSDNYFYLELPDGEKLIYPIKQKSFNVSFGRSVICRLLNKLDKINWKDCLSGETQEAKDAIKFKEAFKEYDHA